jgi:hypothetical protein
VLKGAMMLIVWLGDIIRPTRDVDLLAFGDLSDEAVVEIFREIATTDVKPDGVVFDITSVTIARIREEDAYGGRRVMLSGHLGFARLRVQIDIGIGDAVFPAPEWIEYPSLLDLPKPKLRAYRPETAIAEKLHAMVALGSKNSRMRDFFDILALARAEAFDGDRLARAIRSTFDRRRERISNEPLALTHAFAEVDGKRDQWRLDVCEATLARAAKRRELAFVRGVIHTGLLPMPFVGSLSRAKVFLLMLNPGLSPTDYFGEFEQPAYRGALRNNLFQSERNGVPVCVPEPTVFVA